MRPFAREATPQLRKSIRPFVRESRPLVRDLRPVSARLAKAGPDLTQVVFRFNRFLNLLGYNQNGKEGPDNAARQEGYLFWLAWLNHSATQLFSSSDAHGTLRPVTIAAPCATLTQVLQAQPELEFTSVLTPLLTDSKACNGGTDGGNQPELPELPDLPIAQEQEEGLMQTSTPSFSRVLVMVVFALSCFGLLLFLWLSFGGPIPLKPKGYRVQVGFPEATQLGLEADVRVAGVSVGKLRKKTLDPNSNRTLAMLEIDRKFAPLKTDTKATLRQKSLLGETYVELTPGSSEKTVPEGGRLPNGSVKPTVELDEIFRALDPQTRAAVPHLAAGPRRGHPGPRPGLQRRARHAARLRARRRRHPRGARLAGGRGHPPRQEHRRDVRRADRERAAALEPDHLGGPRVRRHRLAAGQPRRDDPDPADVPRRVEGDRRSACGRSRATRSR